MANKKADSRKAKLAQKNSKEYPKIVKDPDGGQVKVYNKVQEDCVKAGKPFPVDEVKPEKEEKGPKQYPKSIKTKEGMRIVRSKEEELAVRNGKEWVKTDKLVSEKQPEVKGPKEYPKIVEIDGERIKVRNAEEELAVLGEKPESEEAVDFSKMTKNKLENYAKLHFGADLDKRKSKEDLVAEVEALVEAAKNEGKADPEEESVDLETLSEEALVAFAKDNFDADLDIEMGKEALMDEIVRLNEEADLLGE